MNTIQIVTLGSHFTALNENLLKSILKVMVYITKYYVLLIKVYLLIAKFTLTFNKAILKNV